MADDDDDASAPAPPSPPSPALPASDANEHLTTQEVLGQDAARTTAQPHVPMFVCAHCGVAVASAQDVITERAETLRTAVWEYQLDMLGIDDVPVYSATNPEDHRFDVVRLKHPGKGGAACLVGGSPPRLEHSWFPPHPWQMAACCGCLDHLGWAFVAPDNTEPAFVGLICTRLRQRDGNPADVAAMRASAAALQQRLVTQQGDDDDDDDDGEQGGGEHGDGEQGGGDAADDDDEQGGADAADDDEQGGGDHGADEQGGAAAAAADDDDDEQGRAAVTTTTTP